MFHLTRTTLGTIPTHIAHPSKIRYATQIWGPTRVFVYNFNAPLNFRLDDQISHKIFCFPDSQKVLYGNNLDKTPSKYTFRTNEAQDQDPATNEFLKSASIPAHLIHNLQSLSSHQESAEAELRRIHRYLGNISTAMDSIIQEIWQEINSQSDNS